MKIFQKTRCCVGVWRSVESSVNGFDLVIYLLRKYENFSGCERDKKALYHVTDFLRFLLTFQLVILSSPQSSSVSHFVYEIMQKTIPMTRDEAREKYEIMKLYNISSRETFLHIIKMMNMIVFKFFHYIFIPQVKLTFGLLSL